MLSVNVPGRAPYAVLEPKFKWPSGKADYAGIGLPALVSITDPTDVEILWDEVPSLEDQISQRVSDALQGQGARTKQAEEMQRQMLKAALDPRSQPVTPDSPMTDPLKEAMAENTQRALAQVKDPAMREMLIKQYRAAGIHIDEADQAP